MILGRQSSRHTLKALPGGRRSTRRHVALRCEVISNYADEPVPHAASDLSTSGLWVDTHQPLHVGSHVVLCFPMPSWSDAQLTVFARVTRIRTGRRKRDRGPLGMGLEFLGLSRHERHQLAQCLENVRPHAPSLSC
jgi:hypothetical protein